MIRIDKTPGDELNPAIARGFAVPGVLFLVPAALAILGALLDVALFPWSFPVLAAGVVAALFLLNGAAVNWRHERSVTLLASTVPIALTGLLPVVVWASGVRVGLPRELVHLLAATPLVGLGAFLLVTAWILGKMRADAIEIDGEQGEVRVFSALSPMGDGVKREPLGRFTRVEIRKPTSPYLATEVLLVGELEERLDISGNATEGQLLASRVAKETGLPILDRTSPNAHEAVSRFVRIEARKARPSLALVGSALFGCLLWAPVTLSLFGCVLDRALFPWSLAAYAAPPAVIVGGMVYTAFQRTRGRPAEGSFLRGLRALAFSLVPAGIWYGTTLSGAHPLIAELVSGVPLALVGTTLLTTALAAGSSRSIVEVNLDNGVTRQTVEFDRDPNLPLTAIDRIELRSGPELVLVGAEELRVAVDPARAQEEATRIATALGLALTVRQ